MVSGSLVLGPTHSAIISAMIAMGHSLGLTVIAEGAETEEELRLLQGLRCDQVQGYLVSRPLPANEITKLLADSSRVRRLITSHNSASTVSTPTTAQQGGASMFGIINEFSKESESSSNINELKSKEERA